MPCRASVVRSSFCYNSVAGMDTVTGVWHSGVSVLTNVCYLYVKAVSMTGFYSFGKDFLGIAGFMEATVADVVCCSIGWKTTMFPEGLNVMAFSMYVSFQWIAVLAGVIHLLLSVDTCWISQWKWNLPRTIDWIGREYRHNASEWLTPFIPEVNVLD